MRICLVTPSRPGLSDGNGVTATRWAEILTGLGHDVVVSGSYAGRAADLLVALHARRSAASVRAFNADRPRRPVVLALTGTDLYPSLDDADRPVLELADRLIVLQPLGVEQIPADLRAKAVVIVQSALTPSASATPAGAGSTGPASTEQAGRFDVALLANIRRVKDPLVAARAARRLPDRSQVRIRHAGGSLDQRLARVLMQESAANRHYEWVGELPRRAALELVAQSRALLLTSRYEGGANAISEALAAGVPVLASRIAGTVGLLGEDYPGYFEVGDARGLADLLLGAETDRDFYGSLERRVGEVRPMVSPERERDSWKQLLLELSPAG